MWSPYLLYSLSASSACASIVKNLQYALGFGFFFTPQISPQAHTQKRPTSPMCLFYCVVLISIFTIYPPYLLPYRIGTFTPHPQITNQLARMTSVYAAFVRLSIFTRILRYSKCGERSVSNNIINFSTYPKMLSISPQKFLASSSVISMRQSLESFYISDFHLYSIPEPYAV